MLSLMLFYDLRGKKKQTKIENSLLLTLNDSLRLILIDYTTIITNFFLQEVGFHEEIFQ
jgi:hypothetical protein